MLTSLFTMTAWINGFAGIVLSFFIGTTVLGLSLVDASQCIAASMASGMVALFVYSRGSQIPALRRNLMKGPYSTWMVFLTVYFGLMPILAPALRNAKNFTYLILPLILCTGFTILAFGPIQDWFVHRDQRRSAPKG